MQEDKHLSDPTQALICHITWEPLHAAQSSAELRVLKSSGGRWKYEVQLIATDPDVDGVIVCEACLGSSSTVSLPLFAPGACMVTVCSDFVLTNTPVRSPRALWVSFPRGTVHQWCRTVLPFSKLNNFIFGYFDL